MSQAADDSFFSLKELVDKSKSTQQYDSDKKISLLKYLVHTQQSMSLLNGANMLRRFFFIGWVFVLKS
jgi:mediator of RNA polymerase II transcription subunit 14